MTRAPSSIRAAIDATTNRTRDLTNPDRHMTDKQRALARAMCFPGMTPAAASRMAGYSDGGTLAYRMMHDPAFQKLLEEERKAYAQSTGMTRKRVIDGFLRAVELSEMKVDSIAMTAAWREIGRLCGFYAPKVVKHQISVEGEAFKERIKVMTEEELLRLGNGEAVLDGDFEIVDMEDGNAGGDNPREELTRVR